MIRVVDVPDVAFALACGSVLDKAPTAGLWEGQTDETELGITYDENSAYLEGKSVSDEAREKLEKQYVKTAHKREPIPGI